MYYGVCLKDNNSENWHFVYWSESFGNVISYLWEHNWLYQKDYLPLSECPKIADIIEMNDINNEEISKHKVVESLVYNEEKKGYRPVEPIEWE